MSTASQQPDNDARVIAVVGSSARFASLLLAHLQSTMPQYHLVAIDAHPLRHPVKQVSAYRLEPNRSGGVVLTIEDIPEVMQFKAWDLVVDNRLFTMADVPDVLHLESVDTLVHMGSHYDGPDRDLFLGEVQHWIQACRLAEVKQFVYLSDIRVYGVNPGASIPVTENSAPAPLSSHRLLLDAEPSFADDSIGSPSGSGLRTAVLRSAITVGPAGSSPVADELLWPMLSSSRDRRSQFQLMHQYDLAQAIQHAITNRIHGVYNVASKGVVGARTVMDLLGDANTFKRVRRSRTPRRTSLKTGKTPLIATITKYKQATKSDFRYTSEQAARAYCHSYILDPSSGNGN